VSTRHVLATPQAAAEAAGRFILDRLEEAIQARQVAAAAISGGSTPRIMLEWMARQSADWQRVHIFFADERSVPPDHADSNFRMARQALLDHVPATVHRIPAELGGTEAATVYAADLREFFPGGPVFDVLHLGMGSDAHTASLFPGLSEVFNRDQTVAAVWVEKLSTHRITLMPRALLAARSTVALVTGADKAKPLAEVFSHPYDPRLLPIQLIRQEAQSLHWFLDKAAAGQE
jgi:6-phosphogluconolactonase